MVPRRDPRTGGGGSAPRRTELGCRLKLGSDLANFDEDSFRPGNARTLAPRASGPLYFHRLRNELGQTRKRRSSQRSRSVFRRLHHHTVSFAWQACRGISGHELYARRDISEPFTLWASGSTNNFFSTNLASPYGYYEWIVRSVGGTEGALDGSLWPFFATSLGAPGF